jgi:DNA-binding winged helix-turn-helix (wHTH) protein/tetratricopeptide (TPR) repeat protein
MPHSKETCYEFGAYRLDVSRRVLIRAGEAVSLAPKATEILILLVRRAGELIDKEELISEVWPDTIVEEANISQNIFVLRRALGDERKGAKFIETVAKRGYRFIAPVKVVQCDQSGTDSTKSDTSAVLPGPPPILAVLPFLNETNNPDVEFLVDGVTDNIINNLSSISKLHVMSRSAVARYKNHDVDPKLAGRELGVGVIMLGKLNSQPTGLVISVELVDVSNGWQLWGERFDCAKQDMLVIQDRILRQLSETLRLKLTGEEEKRITARYTESGEAYQSYLEGRYHWSKYTRKGIEKAIGFFRRAIEVDPNYALAYAGIVDCYLRLATNYLPPEDDPVAQVDSQAEKSFEPKVGEEVIDSRVKLRHEWDWKGAEREIRRASELKAEYPSAHQWYAAYLLSRRLFQESKFYESEVEPVNQLLLFEDGSSTLRRPTQIASLDLTKVEQVRVFGAIAREQIAVGNCEAADLILRTHRLDNAWPQLAGLSPHAAGDLLFTLGALIGNLAASGRLTKGHRQAEALLNGSIAIFENLSLYNRSGEARSDLGRCYYREGVFPLAIENLNTALRIIDRNESDLRSSCLVVLGAVDRDCGRLVDSLLKLNEAAALCEPRTLNAIRSYFELATTLKELALVEDNPSYNEAALEHFYRALNECDAIGNHLFGAAVQNNLGFLLINIGRYEEAEIHLLRSRRVFQALGDELRAAIVNESLARLYVAMNDYLRASISVDASVEVLERNDGEALLAEALATKGLVLAKLKQPSEAIKTLHGARKVAERCGFTEGIGRVLLILVEQLNDQMENNERREVVTASREFVMKNSGSMLSSRIEQLISAEDLKY